MLTSINIDKATKVTTAGMKRRMELIHTLKTHGVVGHSSTTTADKDMNSKQKEIESIRDVYAYTIGNYLCIQVYQGH